jgi:long-chain acyl-CoA synthetase
MSEIACVADIVRVYGAERPEQVALVLDDRRLSWSELYERSKLAAGALASAGVQPQDRVAFLDKNAIEHFEVLFGAALVNAVCVDVNWRLAAPEVLYIVNNCEAKVLVVGREFVPILDAIAAELMHVTTIAVIRDETDASDQVYETYSSWLARHEAIDPGVISAPEDIALQLYSSGTTGLPKGVMLSTRNMLALFPVAREIWEFSPATVNLVAMPLFHIGGGGWALAGMYQGCTSIIVRNLEPHKLVSLIPAMRVTHAFLVPAALQFMLMAPGVETADFTSLEIIAYGASPISEDVLVRSLEVFQCRFWQAYGLTETTGTVVNLAPEDHDPSGPNHHRLRSCGRPGPRVELRIVDTTSGLDVISGEVGEIWVRSPQVMEGYWKLPEATAEAITPDGWFKTGDAGYLDADGYLYIHDRVKDMIVSGGENVYPAEVENVIMGHPAVADCAVVGVPHDKWGETAKAIVVKQPGSDLSEQELIGYCRERLAAYKCPTSVDWVDALPRNPTGKILRRELRAPFWDGRDRQVN